MRAKQLQVIENVARRVNSDRYTLSLVGSSAVVFLPFGSCGIVPDEIGRTFPIGRMIEGNVCFQIPESETDLILIYSSGGAERRLMRLA